MATRKTTPRQRPTGGDYLTRAMSESNGIVVENARKRQRKAAQRRKGR